MNAPAPRTATNREPIEISAEAADSTRGRLDAAAEWRHRLAGLAIHFPPFSIWSRFGVPWHFGAGVRFVPPVAWYTG